MPNLQKKEKRPIISKQAVIDRVKLNAAGIDLGSREMYIAILGFPVVSFSTYTHGLKEAVDYLKSHAIESVAMESTGIYWFPIYEALDEAGMEVYVVNGRHTKNVPGRKTDVLDSEWLRELHTYGLLKASFVPSQQIRTLRYYVRLRKDHIAAKASYVQHIQKNLDAMNIKLHTVISNIMGESGQKVIRAIAKGITCPKHLLSLCSTDLQKRKGVDILKALEGKYKDEYLFALNQALEIIDMFQEKITSCDTQIETLLKSMTLGAKTPVGISPPKTIPHNKPEIEDFHNLIIKLTGEKDPTTIAGINDYTVLQLVSETGLELKEKWTTSSHFTSWMGLVPSLNKSGKQKGNKKKFRKKVNNAGQIFKQIAQNVGNGKNCALSGFYRRIKGRSGTLVANKATARKIAVYYYDLMTKGAAFVEKGIKVYQERYQIQQRRYLAKQAEELGLQLVAIE